MDFFDKNGSLLRVGDHIFPDEGRELTIVSCAYVSDFEQWCMFGQQVLDPMAFSVLTQEDLSHQWSKLGAETEVETEAAESEESNDENVSGNE